MKAIIFAGGVGTRLWPLSRRKSPKQFEKIIGDKSTLQLTVERLRPDFKDEDIYISTQNEYVEVIQTQLPYIPVSNIFTEPEKRDVGPAVAIISGYLSQKFPEEPFVILWSDHIVKKNKLFNTILIEVGKFVSEKKNCMVFVGQKPRFASENLGWLEIGERYKKLGPFNLYTFRACKYRPHKSMAENFFKNKSYCWNLGYFVSTPKFIYSQFQKHCPDIYRIAEKIVNLSDSENFNKNIHKYYREMPEISFDNAVLEKLDKNYAYVIKEDIGWSDVGAWEALKEALSSTKKDNISQGRVLLNSSQDCLVYNYEGKKTIVGVDLNDILVVNTQDVLLVAKKSASKKIKEIVEGFKGTENEKLT